MRIKPSNREFKKIYNEVALIYEEILNTYALKRRVQILKKWAKGKCLEVGAGSGVISKHLAREHFVIATDISPRMVAEIKKIKNKKIKALVCDAEKLPFKDCYFDTVIASEVIYLLDHPEKFIKEAYRVLKPEGRLLLSSAKKITKIYDRVRALLRFLGFQKMCFDDKNPDFISEKYLKKLLKKTGFKLKEEKDIILIPFESFDFLNRLIEKTFLKYFCAFILIKAEKFNTRQSED